MRRLAPGYVEGISAALNLIPQGIRDRLRGVDFLCEADPAFVGLFTKEDVAGVNREAIATCYYRFGQTLPADRRVTTIHLPKHLRDHEWEPVIAHEMGHALHESIDWGRGLKFGHAAVTEYADTSPGETFAEAFALWVCGWRSLGSIGPYHHARYARPDGATVALFERLAA